MKLTRYQAHQMAKQFERLLLREDAQHMAFAEFIVNHCNMAQDLLDILKAGPMRNTQAEESVRSAINHLGSQLRIDFAKDCGLEINWTGHQQLREMAEQILHHLRQNRPGHAEAVARNLNAKLNTMSA